MQKLKQTAAVVLSLIMLMLLCSGCKTNLPAASSSSSAISLQEMQGPLSCGQFTELLLQNRDLLKEGITAKEAVDFAIEQGIIPSDIESGKPLTKELLAYILTAKGYNFTQFNESHYDWQIIDYEDIDLSKIKYVLMAYAKGLLKTESGKFEPKTNVTYDDAKTVLSRLDKTSELTPPPDENAPYFEYKGLVEVKRLDPTIVLDLKYATADNFTGVVHYKKAVCLLEADTAKRLVAANNYFHKKDYTIKIWDGYRPVSVQWSLYKAAPDNLKQYAPAPSRYSEHAKGIAADITLVDKSGNEMKMPTGFDDFTETAHADYSNLPQEIKDNRSYLRKGMEQQKFAVYSLEWWHFHLPEKSELEISDVGLEEFIEKENEFYQSYLNKY